MYQKKKDISIFRHQFKASFNFLLHVTCECLYCRKSHANDSSLLSSSTHRRKIKNHEVRRVIAHNYLLLIYETVCSFYNKAFF